MTALTNYPLFPIQATQTDIDLHWMRYALFLAAKGLYTAHPNPRVGCVITQKNLAIAHGFHEKTGLGHAEANAIQMAKAKQLSLQGATVYVTLEPCAHFGRTPPCADALIEAGVARVVIAQTDPYEHVAGKGIRKLQAAGIAVEVGLCQTEAVSLNQGFLSRVHRGRPWVTLKAATSLDGRIALQNGVSQWITSPAAREDVQHLRAQSCAILTGSGTILADNPRLTVRHPALIRQPTRVVIDGLLRTPADSAIYDPTAPVILVTTLTDTTRHAPYLARGVTVWILPLHNKSNDGHNTNQNMTCHVDLKKLMLKLGELGINHLMIEAGNNLSQALLINQCIDEIKLYLAPKILGSDAQSLFGAFGLTQLPKNEWEIIEHQKIGDDLKLTFRLNSINTTTSA
ncbi:MAG: bifunctional diaminohydroxyphosphoribosylaminopyrimidine deaminase/5-amino-6-(5-phosphoribosylamino)uracil reductase RibD [Neisseriaceae bacterium]|nr:bifunctional diaminohydroxyphosphoribosylaminopyrimidine deaminase/5-amino-6-(5-phosphoribosylamino)uracil reductase RibD [Neisseriaceae bacterium]